MKQLGRQLWTRLWLRSVQYTDRHARLDTLYRIEDPWNMASDKEQRRFESTNQFISEHLGAVDSLLEIGCGEGHQTAFLARTSKRVLGLDVSQRAVERARRRCPNCEFATGDIDSHRFNETFDLVTACEVLYYMKDVEHAMTRLLTLGRSLLVTYYDGQAAHLSPILNTWPDVAHHRLDCDGATWHMRLWRSDLISPPGMS